MIITMISLLFKFRFCLLELLYKFLTSTLSRTENLKIMMSWHMSDMWLSYPIFAFCSEKFPAYQIYQKLYIFDKFTLLLSYVIERILLVTVSHFPQPTQLCLLKTNC